MRTPLVPVKQNLSGKKAIQWALAAPVAKTMDRLVLLRIAEQGHGEPIDPDEHELARHCHLEHHELLESLERLTEADLLVGGHDGWLLGPNA